MGPMIADEFIIREASGADMPGIARVRTSVTENLLTTEQLAQRGITNASIAASLLANSKGWVAERSGQIVAFSMADRADPSIFALFVLPGYEGRGLGNRLLDLALGWLWDNGAELVWLTTSPETKAARFYARRGWVPTGMAPRGDMRFELRRPASLQGRPR
jgi:GNAT superfamily N-acetyltransferase